MENIYKKGRRKEYKICEDLRKLGFDIVFRSAGSHSPIDVIAINKSLKVIKFIQSKRVLNENMEETDIKLKEQLEREFMWLNNVFRCEFEVL